MSAAPREATGWFYPVPGGQVPAASLNECYPHQRPRCEATIECDAEYADQGMYRVRIGDQLSDLMNISRARELARELARVLAVEHQGDDTELRSHHTTQNERHGRSVETTKPDRVQP